MLKHTLSLLALLFAAQLPAAEDAADFPPQPPVQALSPEEALKTFQLPPGYRLELLLSEPEIKEPVLIAFDGNGRMFVAEMRTYMQDIDGKEEIIPVSRVSLHWSSQGDGKFDKHTVFADKLLLPRILLPLDHGRAIIGETNTNDLYLHTDTDGDGVADKKERWFEGGERGGNLEHQPNGALWAMDNWLYTTYNAYRLRWTPKGPVKEPTAANGGQWGLTQDDHGQIYYINAGGEHGPQTFQVPIVYGSFNPKGQFSEGYQEVFPAVGKADVQGGTPRFRPEDKTLNHFTATCGADIYRGDRLPAELRGDLFFGEPVGRLVRRTKVTRKDAFTTLSNPHQAQKSEFLRSTDPLFRPLEMKTAPDGTLYIVDMYRGIIQEGNWVREGSYLRKVVQQHAFDKVVGRGRIWRLVHETTKLGPPPAMEQETPAQLVAHLEHPNGWWRDTAQKLLILSQDRTVVPALGAMARSHKNYLARLHALWTLEGLEAIDGAMVREKLKDTHPQVRAAAIRVAETLTKLGDTGLPAAVQPLLKDKSPEVVLQAMLTAKLLKWPEADAAVARLAKSPALGVRTIADLILHPPVKTNTTQFNAQEKKSFAAGQEIYNTLCAACHGPDGRGVAMAGAAPGISLAPSFYDSKTLKGHAQGPILVLLHGLTGDIDGKKYEGQMIPMATNDDEWIANVLSFVRNSFGNKLGFVTPQEVAALRAATAQRTQPWTIAELRAALPQPLPNRPAWKFAASHNPVTAVLAVDGKLETRYDTKAFQVPGMWFQIELPAETEIGGLTLETGKSPNDYPREYKVEVSPDGQIWTKPIATGKGSGSTTNIHFPAVTTKFIRITQLGSVKGNYWSIHDLQIYAPAKVPSATAAKP